MALNPKKQPAFRPKKYPDALKPHEIVQLFFNQQPDTLLETEFMMLVKRAPYEYGQHVAWLLRNGLACTVDQIKSWIKVKGLKGGTEAELLNSKLGEYAGVDQIAALEAMAVRTSEICLSYGTILSDRIANGELNAAHIQSIIAQYPAIIGQNKQIIQALSSIKDKANERELLLAGGDRVRQLVLGMLTEHSQQVHKVWLEGFFSAALNKLIEETE